MEATTDYSKRKVDLELLQTVTKPTDPVEVSMSITSRPKIVTGVQKLIQRYCLIFLSIKDAKFDPTLGTDFLQYTLSGALRTREHVTSAFAFANADALNILKEDTGKPDDETIANVELIDYEINFSKSLLILRLLLITKAGDRLQFVLPTSAPRT